MPTSFHNLAAFTLVSQTVTPEYRLDLANIAGTGGMAQFSRRWRRNVERRVYQCPVSDDSLVPSTPINPGKLSPVGWQETGRWVWTRHWVCESHDISREYGTPLSSVYTEVWARAGEWILDEGEDG